jgi:hypothetical protein
MKKIQAVKVSNIQLVRNCIQGMQSHAPHIVECPTFRVQNVYIRTKISRPEIAKAISYLCSKGELLRVEHGGYRRKTQAELIYEKHYKGKSKKKFDENARIGFCMDAIEEALKVDKVTPRFNDDKFIANVCYSFRHDFGMMPKAEQERLVFECKEWMRAIKNNL